MARLPQVGGDPGNWGDVLNEFLLESLSPDGTLKPGSVAGTSIQPGTISESKLDTALAAKVNSSGGGGAVTSVAGKTGVVTLVKADVGLGNVDNTTDLAKPISTATQTALNAKADTSATTTALNAKANLASPALTGTPTAPTPPTSTNSTTLATTAFVRAAITAYGSAGSEELRILANQAAYDALTPGEKNDGKLNVVLAD